jgi:mercuric ion transport protein
MKALPMQPDHSTKKSMWAAALAAIGASVCCVGPLVLLALGIGGSWMSSLTALSPVRPVFMVITLGLLGWAFKNLYITPRNCVEGEVCANPKVQRNQRIIFWMVASLILLLLTFPYYAEYILY